MSERLRGLTPRKPRPQSWYSFSIGRSGIRIQAACNSFENTISVTLELDDQHAKAYYALLETDKEAIERELGTELEWHLKPETKVSYLRLTRHGEDYRGRSRWPEQHDWLVQWLERFELVSRDRVRKLDPADAPPPEPLTYMPAE